MNLSALLGRVELFCATADKLQRLSARTASVKPVPVLHAVVGSPLPPLPLSSHPNSQMVIKIIISCSPLETGSVDI